MTSLREGRLAARQRLQAAGLEEAALEADLLLRHALHLSQTRFLQQLDEQMPDAGTEAIDALLRRRIAGEPTAYLTGQREFWGLDLIVTPATLIPRPETEGLVQAALQLAANSQRDRGLTVVDVGTGSGAIAVALARELPRAEVYAVDLSAAALEVARQNARRHGVERRIAFRRGDLLQALNVRVDLVVANLPYVTSSDWTALPPEIRDHEPRLSLEAGADGLDAIRALLRQAPAYLRPSGAICLEFGVGQSKALQDAASAALPRARIEVIDDFAGLPRILVADCSGSR